jgi:hypothetical protein
MDDRSNFFPALTRDFSGLKDHALSKWLDNNLAVVEQNLANIEQLLYQPESDENFTTAINEIHDMLDVIPLMVTNLQPGQAIYRARTNNKTLFSDQSEISYNTNLDLIGAGRFNRPKESRFYGTLQVDNPKTDHVLNSALECCKELLNKDNPVPLQDLTIGQWRCEQTFPVVNLCFDQLHLAGNAPLQDAVSSFQKGIEGALSERSAAFVYRFINFFSELSRSVRTDQNVYFILNAFFYAVRYYYENTMNMPIPGIVYPGAMSEAKGLNVVLVPPAVDRFLSLKIAVMYRYQLVKGEKQYIADTCSEIVHVIDGRFQFKKVRPYAVNGTVFHYK